MKGLIVFLFIALMLTSCKETFNKVEFEKRLGQNNWKYGGGASIGDWVDFETAEYTVKGDTILKKNLPVAVVSHMISDKLRDSYEMKITVLATGESGFYYAK